MSEGGLIKTGIKGLDSILVGGIPRTNVILLQGVTGSGKTLFGLEFIYRGITQYNEPGLIVVFETSPDKLIRDAAGFGWNLDELQQQNKLQIIFTSPQVFAQELRSPDSLLLDTASEMGAQRIFVDGIGLLNPDMGGDNSERRGYRELLQQLIESLNRENLTAIFSLELGCAHDSIATVETADFLADTVVQLGRQRYGRRIRRSLEILKSRGQDYEPGEHTLQIIGGEGLQIFRRVQAPLRSNSKQPTSNTKRSAIGVDAIDTLIGGGIFDGSTTMVVGVSGVGKTVLSAQILREGALKHKTRGLLVSLDEHPAQIIRNAQTLGLGIEDQIADGTIRIMFESPQELDIDSHYARIVHLIEEHDIQRMVIDGTTSYTTAIGEVGVYRDFFHAIVAYSKQRQMTTFFNYENPEFLGISSYMPDFPVNSIVDNLILLTLVEINSSLHRCISVVKARGSKHSFDTREFVIGQGECSGAPGTESGSRSAAAELLQSLEPGPDKILPPSANQRRWRGTGQIPFANKSRGQAGQTMITEVPEQFDASDRLPAALPIPFLSRGGVEDASGSVELSPELRADLLDLDAWGDILTMYGRTMKVAVALTDVHGHLLGKCHNAQPIWRLINDAAPNRGAGCPFCLTTRLPCTAVADALQAERAVMMRDQAGLAHVAVPLSLGTQHLGAIIAGQVFDRFPELLPLRRLAKEFGVSSQQLWDVAKKQHPISNSALQASGDLLRALSQTFLQQRYDAILKAKLTSGLDATRMQLQALLAFSQSMIAEQKDARRLLEILCDTARQLVGARFAISGVIKDGTILLDPFVVSGVDSLTSQQIPSPRLDRGVLALILAEGEMVSVADIREDPVAAAVPSNRLRNGAFLGFPIGMRGGMMRGILGVIEKLDESDFNSENERILQEVVNHAAVCFENIRRYEEIQHQVLKLELEITQRTQAEEALEKSEAKYRGLLEAAPDAMVVVNQDGDIVLLNVQAEKQFGYRRDELLGKNVKNIIPEGFAERLIADALRSAEDALAQQMGTGIELTGRRKDGSDFPIEIMLSPLDSAEGILVTAAIRNISVRKAAEEHLVQTEAQYRQLFENAPSGMYRAAEDGRLLQVNHALVAMLGYETVEELLSKNMAQDVYGDAGPRSRLLEQVERTGQVKGAEMQWTRKDGKQITVRVNGRAVQKPDGQVQALEVIAEDISMRVELEKQNQGLQKFEAIGKLAGGIAHDFNNVMAAVLGWADVGMKRSTADSVVHSYFERIAKQAQRAAGLTQQLLAFARRQILEPRALDLNQQIKETIVLLEKILGEHIEIQTTLATDLDITLADPTQMEQVLMNLLVNARDAMPSGGRIRIETQNVVLDEKFCRTHVWGNPGRYLALSVSDTGVGMDAATLEHIFEPFFTTKNVGEGTGLGLATVYGIVKQHNGFIHVYSEIDSGTKFRIYLPAIPGIPGEEATKEPEIVKGGTETILLVEDNEDLLEIGQAALEQLGYKILTATNGAEAVQIFEKHHSRIELVVLDVIMPKLTGPEAYTKMCQIKPGGFSALFTTGYSEELSILAPLREREIEVLQKPCSPDDLALKIRQVLDRTVKH